METWHHSAGISWLSYPLPDGADEGTHVVGVVLGSGYAQQKISHLGSAEAAAEILRRELSRPVESAAGSVQQIRVSVDVHLQDTTILLQGEPTALAERIRWLDATLRDPSHLDLSDPRVTDDPFRGWGRELAAWFGVGPATLAQEIQPPWTGPSDVLLDTIRRLHPRLGTPAVALTSVESLIGSAFGTDGVLARPQPLRWNRRGPESFPGAYVNHVLTARVTASVSGYLAAELLLNTIHRALLMLGGTEGMQVQHCTVGDHRLLLVTVNASPRGYDAAAVHRTVVNAVDVCRGLSVSALQDQIDKEQKALSTASSRMNPLTHAVETLRTGVRRSSANVASAITALHTDDLRRELQASLDRMMLSLPPGAEPPAGYPVVDTEPVAGATTATSADPLARRRFQHLLPPANGSRGSVRAKLDGPALTVITTVGRGAKGYNVGTVDLSRIVARVDYGDSISILIDDRDRRVRVPWPAIKRGTKVVRQAVDAATAPEQRLVLPPDPAYSATLTKQRATSKAVLIAVVSFLVVFGGIAVAANYFGEQDQPTVVTEVPAGNEVALANGTTLTVANIRLQPVVRNEGQVLLADVSFCGGGPTVEKDTSANARNYIGTEKFSLQGVDSAVIAETPADFTLLYPTTLADGECTEGGIGFMVPNDAPRVGIVVRYTNLMGDQVDWRW